MAAADLLGVPALVLEERGSRTRICVCRHKVVQGAFVTLIGASVRTLLYSSDAALLLAR